MKEPLQITIQSSILDRHRKLTLDPAYIEFEDKDLRDEAPSKFLKNEITGLRYGIKWIEGYQFTIGRIYCIDIQSSSKQVIKLRLKSIYGIRRKEVGEKYAQIVNALYDLYFDDISRDYLKLFGEGNDFEILGVSFNSEGIVVNKKVGFISWEDLGSKSYMTYYTLFSKHDPTKYRAFEHLHDWNTGILYSVSRQILKEKGLWSD